MTWWTIARRSGLFISQERNTGDWSASNALIDLRGDWRPRRLLAIGAEVMGMNADGRQQLFVGGGLALHVWRAYFRIGGGIVAGWKSDTCTRPTYGSGWMALGRDVYREGRVTLSLEASVHRSVGGSDFDPICGSSEYSVLGVAPVATIAF